MDLNVLEIIVNLVEWRTAAIVLLIGLILFKHYYDQKIDLLNTKIDLLNTKIKTNEDFHPDTLIARLLDRHKAQSEQIEILLADKEKNISEISRISIELEKSQLEIQHLSDLLSRFKGQLKEAEELGNNLLLNAKDILKDYALIIQEFNSPTIIIGSGKKLVLDGKRTKIQDSVTGTEYVGPNLPGKIEDYYFDFTTSTWKLLNK